MHPKLHIGYLLILMTIVLSCSCMRHIKATPEQARYLTKQLTGATGLVIRSHAKIGGEVIATISDQEEIAHFLEATETTLLDPPCACFGFIELDFSGPQGVISLQYNESDKHLKFNNPWQLQAIASEDFCKLVRKYSRNK